MNILNIEVLKVTILSINLLFLHEYILVNNVVIIWDSVSNNITN